ncbi:FUSC family protein [Neorhizobium sp. P12A]|uniref:FUSC family protein n=1 Tax=Neorhizobium sp. P12A TaxID=2268027 RepID=UPI0011ECEF30|nr:FUSC family protein [Neorhizobium sp. P12A]KAA0697560.1 FUSC family protein [Neorhizobium sp. P12A]
MHLGHQLRDWLAANDPAFSRLRQATRVTLTIAFSFVILFAIHIAIVPLPTITYALGILLSIQGGLTVRDTLPSQQLVTRLLGCVASIVVVILAALFVDHRYISDFVFLLIIFAASWGRAIGVRWNAVGMFAFMSYFMGAYFQPKLAEIPLVGFGSVVAVLVAHAVRVWLLPDDWRRDLLRALESVRGRVNQILVELAAAVSDGKLSEGERRALTQSEERLKEAVLMAESFVPKPADSASSVDSPDAEVAMRLFDIHLAAESVIVLSQHAPPSFALVHSVIDHDEALLRREIDSCESMEDKDRAETARALIWLDEARNALGELIQRGRSTGFRALEASQAASSTPVTWPKLSLDDPATRSSLQITLATSIAMILGLMLSRERWFWAVLTAFLVFNNTSSRGDTAVRAMQRSVGTVLGIVIGMLLAALVEGHMAAAIVLSVISIFLAFYFLQVSYGAMTFFITIVLCLIYGMTGALSFHLLDLRVEETILGAVTGTLVAFFVFPAKTRSILDTALLKWFDALRALLNAAFGNGSGMEIIQLSQKLDAAYRDVATAARPLGASWYVVKRPGHIRQTLAIFMACTYWARIFARNIVDSRDDPDGEIRKSLEENLKRIDAIAPKGSDCFFVQRKTPRTVGQNLPLSRHGKRLGVEMVGSMLDRLYP